MTDPLANGGEGVAKMAVFMKERKGGNIGGSINAGKVVQRRR